MGGGVLCFRGKEGSVVGGGVTGNCTGDWDGRRKKNDSMYFFAHEATQAS